jgi:hypothetical protein
MASPQIPKRKEPPTEPFRPTVDLAVRATAGGDQVQDVGRGLGEELPESAANVALS